MSLYSKLEVPFKDKVVEPSASVTRAWGEFFRLIRIIIEPLGREKSFTLLNNVTVANDITDLTFSSTQQSCAAVDYLIQRVTTGTGAVELVQTGTFYLAYKPTSLSWALVGMGTPAPSNAGVTLSVTSKGQIQYTSTNITGTPSISQMFWRARTLAGKNYKYSEAGR